jgi:CRP-like cAMP-binding protein
MAYDGVVQMPGLAVKISAAAMTEELHRPGSIHDVLGRYAWTLLADAIQIAACNNFHSVTKRCARWLLTMDDAARRDDFPITQDLLALMLGVRRATITRAAQALHRAGLIDYKHGHLSVRDRPKLEAESCECYGIMRETRHRLLGY